MKDNLEDFIRSNREDFDMASPDLKVWANIDKSLEARRQIPRRVSLWRNFAAAAAVLLLVGMGTLIGMQLNSSSTAPRTLGDISVEYQELEDYYQSQLREKQALLASQNPDASVIQDLTQLEGFLGELQMELQDVPKGSEEQIVNAMIENYQDRLEILERVLSRIQNNSNKSKNNEEINL